MLIGLRVFVFRMVGMKRSFNPTEDPMTAGRLVEAIIKYRGLKIEEVADMVHWHLMNFYKLLNGSKPITEAMAIRLAEVLNVNPAIILHAAMLESLGMLNDKAKKQ